MVAWKAAQWAGSLAPELAVPLAATRVGSWAGWWDYPKADAKAAPLAVSWAVWMADLWAATKVGTSVHE